MLALSVAARFSSGNVGVYVSPAYNVCMMVRQKIAPEPAPEGQTFIVKCIGECGRGVEVTLDHGIVFKQINVICAGCSKETKYAIPKATATKFVGLPPGQTALEG